jgi:1,4-alpha-glucan branching enzyme
VKGDTGTSVGPPAQGYFALVLHAHLPFVRHPEHDRFLEENWLFEAITESYLPLLQNLQNWERDGLAAPVTLTLTPTLCSMLDDPLLRERYVRHMEELLELADKEVHRTHWEKPLNQLALFYHERFVSLRQLYEDCGRDLVGAFRKLQDAGRLEIITCAATHALLPLLAGHPPSVRAQILVARDHYRACFGRDPRGIWLPECAYSEGLENVLHEAGLRWFITDSHGILHARPRPRYATFAPILTPNGVAVFGRDLDSAKQVWSRNEGYPGDPRYRDFYRDIGFDLELEYLKPYLRAGERRGFTGIKYYRITGNSGGKTVYERTPALQAAEQHAAHFVAARTDQIGRLADILERPPLIVSPYDAELFGHWWYEGPEFLDAFVRKAAEPQSRFALITPENYLERQPVQQIATPSPSSWGEEGYWGVWLNEKNQWIYPHLMVAQERMTELARRFPEAQRALKQAARELLLAQASDWAFILRTGTSPEYATRRVNDHLSRFTRLYEQLMASQLDEAWLSEIEGRDNIFQNVQPGYWA